ncbi:MAG TPA: DUF6569 family protein [Ktedonobacterales bacterium]
MNANADLNTDVNTEMNANADTSTHAETGAGTTSANHEGAAAPVVAAVQTRDATAEQMSPSQGKRTASQVIFERLTAIDVGEPVAHERMVVFPLYLGGDTASALRYSTLEQALAAGSVEVTEQASATVPELVLHNKSTVQIFVLDGEEIVGGRQNRIVNASFLVGANATVPLPVTCVEHGRWYSTSRTFSSGEASYHSLRSEKFTQVHESLRRGMRHSSDQGAVWNSVAAKAMRAGAASPTGAMHEIYESRSGSLDAYLGAFPYMAGACGFAVALGGQMAGADLFDQPATAQVLWPKLLRSYAMDALDSLDGGSIGREGARRLFERVRGVAAETYPSLALGEDVRFAGDGVVGGGLVYEETPVHISIFRTSGASSMQPSTMARASQSRMAYQQRSQPVDRTP